MAAAIAPFRFTALADLGCIFVKEIASADESVADDARADIGGDDQFDFTVRHTVAVGPAFVVDFLDHLMASTASTGAPVCEPCTLEKPAASSREEYSANVRSLPSVQMSIFSDCIWTCVGPRL